MIITHNIKMDLARNSIQASVDAVQGDKNGRQLKITLLANNTAWNIPGGAVAVIRYRRTDGTGGEYGSLSDGSAAYSISGNVLTVTLAPQVCAEPGKVTLTVALMLGDVELNTFAVDLNVQYNPDIDAEDPEYEVEDPTLEDRVVVLEATCSRLIGEIAGMTQLTPEFANSIAECTDTSKLYVLPDGYIYAYMACTEYPYTNQIPLSIDSDGSRYNSGWGWKSGYRLNSSGEEVAAIGVAVTGFIPVKAGDVIRFKDVPWIVGGGTGSDYIAVYKSDFSLSLSSSSPNGLDGVTYMYDAYTVDDETGYLTSLTIRDKYDEGVAYLRISATGMSGDAVITVNEEITGEGVVTYAWSNTGHAFVPTDYEDRILDIEEDVDNLKKAVQGDMAVYGIVDSENTIYMTGTLSTGTYTLKYQHDDGTTTDICTFTMN